MSNIVKNKYIFSFLGCLFVLLFSASSNAFLGHLTPFDANNEIIVLVVGLRLCICINFFGLGLLLYFYSKKIF
jgi:hypothetical protein